MSRNKKTHRNRNTPYTTTHIGTKRYMCIRSENKKTGDIGFPIVKKGGTYEPLLSFKELPKYDKLESKGRGWPYTKNYKPVMDRIVLDIDSPDDLGKAFEVTKKIMQELEEYNDSINLYFSGSKGVHCEILTEELNIIDTTVEQPKNACIIYTNFLNYFQDKYNEVDLSLKDVGTRIIRRHHTKHEKTGNYKILIDINASLDDIIKSSKNNRDMVKFKKKPLSEKEALNLLNSYSKPLDNAKTEATIIPTNNITDSSVYINVYNDLKTSATNIHHRIILIGAGLNGYVTREELENIYSDLSSNTDIKESSNAKQSFIDAFENDREPYNLGALRNHYKDNKIEMGNFYRLSEYLENKRINSDYKKFREIFKSYNNDWFKMLETELYDYVDNTDNIFIGIIHCLMALYGYGGRIIVVNGGSTVGKSEFISTLEKLMVEFIDYGNGTPASVVRRGLVDVKYFDKKIVYLGDKGLSRNTQNSKEEFAGLYQVFGALSTDNKVKRPVVINTKPEDIHLEAEGICVLYTEPYTDLKKNSAGDQYITRSTFVKLNPIKDVLKVCEDYVFNEGKENIFYKTHKGYINYILNNPLTLKLKDKTLVDRVYNNCGDARTFKYVWGLLKAYCQYMRIEKPNADEVKRFLELFQPQQKITPIERELYDVIYRNLKPLTEEEADTKLDSNGSVYNGGDFLKRREERKEKSFFTHRNIKTYFKSEMRHNPHLKDVCESEEQIKNIIENLYNAGLLDRIEEQYKEYDVYYIVKDEEMDNKLKEEKKNKKEVEN